jgi:hypothetical protein
MKIDRNAPISDLATGALQLVNHGSTMWQTQQLLRDIRLTQSTEPKTPDCEALFGMLRGLGDLMTSTGSSDRAAELRNRLQSQWKPNGPTQSSKKQLAIMDAPSRGGIFWQDAYVRKAQQARGGIVGLAAVLIPALAAGIPAAASAISEIVHTWRGGTPMGHDDMGGLVNEIEDYLAGSNLQNALTPDQLYQMIGAVRSNGYTGSDFDEMVGDQVKSALQQLYAEINKKRDKPCNKRCKTVPPVMSKRRR